MIEEEIRNILTKALKDGKTIEVNMEPVYQGNSMKPTRFHVEYSINGGKSTGETHENAPGGK